MKNKREKIIGSVVTIILLVSVGITSDAHSGRTDANGGHKDNKNKSGLGSYHYHCGSNPAHLHKNGVCPYAKTSTKQKSSTSSNTKNQKVTKAPSSSSTQKQEQPKIIEVESVVIHSDKKELELGEELVLKVELLPSNASNKSITWKSKNEMIATVDEQGKVKAITSGKVEIVTTTSNGKTDTFQITILENKKIEQNAVENKTNTMVTEQDRKEKSISGAIGSIVGVMLLSGAGYLAYKKIKK